MLAKNFIQLFLDSLVKKGINFLANPVLTSPATMFLSLGIPLHTTTTINIVDPEGRVVTFSYTYVDGLFEVYYGNKKLPNSGDPEFTITNGKLTAILNNGTYFTLTPTDEQIDVGGKDEPEGSLSNPIVLGELPETVTFTSDTENRSTMSLQRPRAACSLSLGRLRTLGWMFTSLTRTAITRPTPRARIRPTLSPLI